MGVTRLEINLNALKHNYTYLRAKLAKGVKMMGVVKAFGYGTDACEVALFLEKLGIDYFAVAYAYEGEALRKAGIQAPILVLHPQPDNFKVIIENCLEPSLYSARLFREFSAFAKAHTQKHYPVHLKFNTGLNRLGFWENDTDWILERLKETEAIKITSIFSHLAASEDVTEKAFTQQQITSFTKTANILLQALDGAPFLHQSNTSAIINYPEAQFDMVRTGIGLYGYGNTPEEDQHLRPVASLKSIISQIHTIEPNETVGYNRAYKATHYEKTATIPIGHADGISRAYGNGIGYVTIHGKKAPIIGNVCMDMLMVNITDIDCKEGDDVTIFGEDVSAVDVSASINSISYELLTAVSQRVKRVVLR
ncbi:alanine racemase [uncultured Dokdonia sp.]|uniref:alanine racemase n=1 Tax=uncultured Dokdonia sp. TaxID=575653 RepID=UPI002633AB15|nr:alanine racemase [uncultured Dokdonia sp.]